MNKSPAFQFYASDFLVDTAEMTNQEIGVYIRLLSHQWVNSGLNSDPNRLANMVGMDLLEVWDEIKHKFDLGDDGKIRNPKLEKVRQTQINYRNKQSEAGKRGAAKRWDNKVNSNPNSNPNGEKVAFQSSSSSSVSQKKRASPFVPPTIDQVNEYCCMRANKVDPQAFIDHYEANGWMRGNRKMCSWKKTVQTWKANNFNQPAPTKQESPMKRLLDRSWADGQYAGEQSGTQLAISP